MSMNAFWFQSKMKMIMLHCFVSVKHQLRRRIGYFDLYGLDFMIDDRMKVVKFRV